MRLVLVLVLLLLPALALADEPAVMPIAAAEPAPFDGLLVPEGRMAVLLACDLRRVEAEGHVAARDLALKTLEAELAVERQRQISGTWWSRNGFWFGAGLGAATVLGVVWLVK